VYSSYGLKTKSKSMKNLRKYLVLFLVCAGVVVFNSCSDNKEFDSENNIADIESSFLPTGTIDQKLLLEKMDETAQILIKFADNEEVNAEISLLIKKNMYKDDFIFFKDLFNPEDNSILKSISMTETNFSKAFKQASAGLVLKSGSINDLTNFLIENNVALYVPYSLENYPDDRQTPTISFHPLINDSLNYGYKQLSGNSFKSATFNDVEYEKVDGVCEEYAQEYPVYLIVPKDFEDTQLKGANANLSSNKVHEIQVGWVFLTKHYDGLFNGGSELRFTVGGVTIGTNGHVTGTLRQQIPCDISRQMINDAKDNYWKGWKELKTVLDTNWEVADKELAIVVWEYDQRDEKTVSLGAKRTAGMEFKDPSTGITYKVGDEVSSTVSVKYYSDDDIIYAMPWDRDWFMATNKNWQSWSFKGEWGRDGFSYRKLTENLIITSPHTEIYY
jgi:hypothetical protein